MLKSELLEIIANRENSGVEFKRDDIRPEQLAKEVVAMLNVQGGRVLLGVEDDGTISGIARENTQEWVLNVFRDKIHPRIIPFYEEIQIEDTLRVAVISFSQGVSKPYIVRHNNREETYIRMGDRSEIASREQQVRLFESGGLLHVELLPVAGTSFTSLDFDRLNFYFEEVIKDPEIPDTEEEWEDRLAGMGFLVEDGLGKIVCTIAGLVLFGIKPRRYLRQSGVRVIAFSSDDKQYEALLDQVVDAPMIGRWKINKSEKNRQLIDEGLVEKLSILLGPYLSQESAEIDELMRREKKWLYPWEAVREAFINALVHRDWTRAVDVEIVFYSDRLEITSPGCLQNSMTIKKMISGLRSPRNSLIAEVMKDYGYVDARGMGVRTKIIPLMKQQNKSEPIFEATVDYLKTTLPTRSDILTD